MSRITKFVIIALSAILFVVAAGLYFMHNFLSSFAPPSITVTKDHIVTNRDLMNGVTIEKIEVDSMGNKGYPAKYTTIYATSCHIHQPVGKRPERPDIIVFNEPGKYAWDEDTVRKRYVHDGLSGRSSEPANDNGWRDRFGNHPTCPIHFEKEQWYFITIGDPQVTGIFFYIDVAGKEHQYILKSGVSPV